MNIYTGQVFRGNLSGIDALITVSPLISTNYWVRVSNSCGRADSVSASVTLNVACNSPVITSQPLSQTIASGGSATLSVAANGTPPLTYQWYQGNSSDTTTALGGATTGSITVSPSATTAYWAAVSGPCGYVATNTATVTVTSGGGGGGGDGDGGPKPFEVVIAPNGVTATSNENETITVSWQPVTASSPMSYEIWRWNGHAFVPVASTAKTSYADRGLRRGQLYRYVVVTTDGRGHHSAPSHVVSTIVR